MELKSTEKILFLLENIHTEPVEKMVIKQRKYQFEIENTGIKNSIKDMYDCYVYDGNCYKETTLNNIISCVQDVGFESATVMR